MFYSILLGFFTVFGILEVLSLLWEMFFVKFPQNGVTFINLKDNCDFKAMSGKYKNTNVVFVYDDENDKRIDILKRKFQFADFIMRENLPSEISKLI